MTEQFKMYVNSNKRIPPAAARALAEVSVEDIFSMLREIPKDKLERVSCADTHMAAAVRLWAIRQIESSKFNLDADTYGPMGCIVAFNAWMHEGICADKYKLNYITHVLLMLMERVQRAVFYSITRMNPFGELVSTFDEMEMFAVTHMHVSVYIATDYRTVAQAVVTVPFLYENTIVPTREVNGRFFVFDKSGLQEAVQTVAEGARRYQDLALETEMDCLDSSAIDDAYDYIMDTTEDENAKKRVADVLLSRAHPIEIVRTPAIYDFVEHKFASITKWTDLSQLLLDVKDPIQFIFSQLDTREYIPDIFRFLIKRVNMCGYVDARERAARVLKRGALHGADAFLRMEGTGFH